MLQGGKRSLNAHTQTHLVKKTKPRNTGTRAGGRRRRGARPDDDGIVGKVGKVLGDQVLGDLLDGMEGRNNGNDDTVFGDVDINVGVLVPTILITGALLALLIQQ